MVIETTHYFTIFDDKTNNMINPLFFWNSDFL